MDYKLSREELLLILNHYFIEKKRKLISKEDTFRVQLL